MNVAARRPVTAMGDIIAFATGRSIRLRAEAASRNKPAADISAACNRMVAHREWRASIRAMIFRPWHRAADIAIASLAVLVMLFMASCSSTHKDSGGLPTHLPDIQLSGSTDTPPHSMASYEYPFDTNGRYVSDWAAEGERRAGRAAGATSDDTSKWGRSHGGSSGGQKKGSTAKVTSTTKSASKSKSDSSPKIADSDSTSASSKTGSKSKPASSSPKVADSDSKPASSKTGSKSKPASSSAKVADNDSKPASSKTASKSKPESSSPKVANNDDEPTGTSKPALKRKPSSDDDVASTAPPKSSTSSKAKSSSSKSGRKYTVKSGDTLSHIAANYGVSVAKIKAANGMSSDFLSIGKVLRIP